MSCMAMIVCVAATFLGGAQIDFGISSGLEAKGYEPTEDGLREAFIDSTVGRYGPFQKSDISNAISKCGLKQRILEDTESADDRGTVTPLATTPSPKDDYYRDVCSMLGRLILGNTTSQENVVSRFKTSIEIDSLQHVECLLLWIRYNEISDQQIADLHALYESCFGKQYVDPRGKCCDLLWTEVFVRSSTLSRDDWETYLGKFKAPLKESLDGLSGSGLQEKLNILEQARRKLALDVFPFFLDRLISGKGDYDELITALETGGNRVTPEILAVICKARKGNSSGFFLAVDRYAGEYFNSSSEELLMMNVDVPAVVKSLNLDQWPQQYLDKPMTAEAMEAIKPVSPVKAAMTAAGYEPNAAGFFRAIEDGIQKQDDKLIESALLCFKYDRASLSKFERLYALYHEWREKASLKRQLNPVLQAKWFAQITRSGKMTKNDWSIALDTAKMLLLNSEDRLGKDEAILILRQARFQLGIRTAPCVLGGLLAGKLSTSYLVNMEAWDQISSHGEDDEALSADMLKGIGKVQSEGIYMRESMKYAIKKYSSLSFDDFVKQEVDIDALRQSLDLEHWPESAIEYEEKNPGHPRRSFGVVKVVID